MGDDTVSKPFPGYEFDTFEGCVAAVSDEDGIDDPEAFCQWLDEQGEAALSDPNADEILTDLTVEYVSAVDVPAQDSQWVIAKHAERPDGTEHRWGAESPILIGKRADGETAKDDDTDRQIAYAPVLIPGEVDKQGDVVPDHEIEQAAHKYLAEYRKVDADHDLLGGKGVPVESWVAKKPTKFELPDGTESREYPEGTWFIGIKFADETWDRVRSGELTGLSIFGGARPVPVDDVFSGLEGSAETAQATAKAQTHMSNDDTETTAKQEMGAEGVSALLAEFRGLVDDGTLPRDATLEAFVKELLSSGAVDEQAVTGLDVFLGDGSGGDGDGDMPDDGGDDEADGMGDEQEDGLEMSGKSDSGDAPDADGDGGDGGDSPDDDLSDIRDTLKSIDDRVGDFDDRIGTLEAELETVKSEVGLDDPDGDRMENDDGTSERMKSADGDGGDVGAAVDRKIRKLFDVDPDADADVVRKAIAEQAAAGGDSGEFAVDYDGISDTDEADGGSASRGASANRRMARTDGGD